MRNGHDPNRDRAQLGEEAAEGEAWTGVFHAFHSELLSPGAQ